MCHSACRHLLTPEYQCLQSTTGTSTGRIRQHFISQEAKIFEPLSLLYWAEFLLADGSRFGLWLAVKLPFTPGFSTFEVFDGGCSFGDKLKISTALFPVLLQDLPTLSTFKANKKKLFREQRNTQSFWPTAKTMHRIKSSPQPHSYTYRHPSNTNIEMALAQHMQTSSTVDTVNTFLFPLDIQERLFIWRDKHHVMSVNSCPE